MTLNQIFYGFLPKIVVLTIRVAENVHDVSSVRNKGLIALAFVQNLRKTIKIKAITVLLCTKIF